MNKKLSAGLLTIALLVCAGYPAFAHPPAKPADRNRDGVVDLKERRLAWRHYHSRVNTNLEKKYDKNKDGWLEPAEAKKMLQDRYAIIQTDGKAKVDSPLEAEYDANKDGVIDAREAEVLKADLNLK